MCGIVAVINFDGRPVDRDLLIKMRDTMIHRGPDDSGIHVNGCVGLAHRRLSIIDLSPAGCQPLVNEDGLLSLVANGEVYNYIELRQNLERKGHRFSSLSDSETIIHQYEEEDIKCLSRFNGMFAFVLWDMRYQRVFAARDRIGIKPLYYYIDKRRCILASEIKAILADPSVTRGPDYRGIADYYFAGRPLNGKTLFKSISELLPGHSLCADLRGRAVQTQKYWDLSFDYNFSRTEERITEDLFHLIDNAVQMNCRSDARLGCHLSGGVDSSTVTAFASRHRKNLKAFCIKFSDDVRIDETAYAKHVAKNTGAKYYEDTPPAMSMARMLPLLMWHMDLPMANVGGFSYFCVSRLARKHVKVSLTGHGGDELFAGYPAQFLAAFNTMEMFPSDQDYQSTLGPNRWTKFTAALRRKEMMPLARAFLGRLRNAQNDLESLWIRLHCRELPIRSSVFSHDFLKLKDIEGYSPVPEFIGPLQEAGTEEILDRCLYHDLKVYLPSLLHLEDRVSMALSLESRVPLLDHHIAEYLATVPPDQKVPDKRPKHLLRMAAAPVLPEEVCERMDKRPFPVPREVLYSQEMKQLTTEVLLSPKCKERGIFTEAALSEACRDLTKSWPLLNIELWCRIFLDGDMKREPDDILLE